NFMSCRFAPSTAKPTGPPAPFAQNASLHPSFRPVRRVRPRFFSAQRRLRHRSIHRLPRPLKTFHPILLFQGPDPSLLKNTAATPFLEPRMRHGTTANPRLVQRLPIGNLRPPAAGFSFPRLRQQFFYLVPKTLGNPKPPRRLLRFFHHRFLSTKKARL